MSCKLKWLTLKNGCTTDWWRSQLWSKQPTINNKKSLLIKDRDCLICHWVTAVEFEMASREQLEQCLVLVLDGFCCFQKGKAVFLSYLNNHFTYFGYVVDLKKWNKLCCLGTTAENKKGFVQGNYYSRKKIQIPTQRDLECNL